MGFKAQTPPTDLDIPSSHLFFLPLLLEQALSAPAAEKPLVSSVKLEAVVSVIIVLLYYSILELVASALFASSIFLLLTYFSSSSYLKQSPYHIIVQWSWAVVQTT